MSIIKGFPTSDKLLEGGGLTANYATLQPVAAKRHALDVISITASEFSTSHTILAGSAGNIILSTAHGARVGDMIKFVTPTALVGAEVAVIGVSDANSFTIGSATTLNIVGGTFDVYRYSSVAAAASGGVAGDSKVAKYNASLPTNADNTTVWLQTDVNGILLVNTSGASSVAQDVVLTSRIDYSVTNVTTGAWVQIVADTGAKAITEIQIFDSAGYTLELGVGVAPSEVHELYIFPGGNNNIAVSIPANSRLSLRAIGIATVDVGENIINYVG